MSHIVLLIHAESRICASVAIRSAASLFLGKRGLDSLFTDSQSENLQAALPCMLVADCVSVLIQLVQIVASSCLIPLIEDSFEIGCLTRAAFPAVRAWNSARRFP